jgi:hypothetical protein
MGKCGRKCHRFCWRIVWMISLELPRVQLANMRFAHVGLVDENSIVVEWHGLRLEWNFIEGFNSFLAEFAGIFEVALEYFLSVDQDLNLCHLNHLFCIIVFEIFYSDIGIYYYFTFKVHLGDDL